LKERNFDIKVLLLDQKEEKALNCKFHLIQPTSFTFASESVTATENGSSKTKLANRLSREGLRSRCTTVRLLSLRFTLGSLAEATVTAN